jgi:hypothetical protein
MVEYVQPRGDTHAVRLPCHLCFQIKRNRAFPRYPLLHCRKCLGEHKTKMYSDEVVERKKTLKLAHSEPAGYIQVLEDNLLIAEDNVAKAEADRLTDFQLRIGDPGNPGAWNTLMSRYRRVVRDRRSYIEVLERTHTHFQKAGLYRLEDTSRAVEIETLEQHLATIVGIKDVVAASHAKLWGETRAKLGPALKVLEVTSARASAAYVRDAVMRRSMTLRRGTLFWLRKAYRDKLIGRRLDQAARNQRLFIRQLQIYAAAAKGRSFTEDRIKDLLTRIGPRRPNFDPAFVDSLRSMIHRLGAPDHHNDCWHRRVCEGQALSVDPIYYINSLPIAQAESWTPALHSTISSTNPSCQDFVMTFILCVRRLCDIENHQAGKASLVLSRTPPGLPIELWLDILGRLTFDDMFTVFE